MGDSKKIYYSVKELSEMFDVNRSLIRHWTKEFDEIDPHIGENGSKYYRVKDLQTIKIIYHLTKVEGFTIKGVKKRLKNRREESDVNYEILTNLKEAREELLSIREEIAIELQRYSDS